jgi:Fibronectin type III domain
MATLRTTYGYSYDSAVYVIVQSVNSIGPSANTTQSSGAKVQDVPAVMVAPTQDAVDQRSVDLDFTELITAAERRGAPITKYTIQYKFANDSVSNFTNTTDYNTPVTQPVTVSNLNPGSSYVFRIYATNRHGEGLVSPYSSTVTTTNDVPEAPTVLAHTLSGDEMGIVIEWNDNLLNGLPITRYNIWIRRVSDSLYIEDTTDCDGSDSGIMTA